MMPRHDQSSDQKMPQLVRAAAGRGRKRFSNGSSSCSVSTPVGWTEPELTVECVGEQREETNMTNMRREGRRGRRAGNRSGERKMIALRAAGHKNCCQLGNKLSSARAESTHKALKPNSLFTPLLLALSRAPLNCMASEQSLAATAALERSDVALDDNIGSELDNWVPSSRDEAEAIGLDPGRYLSNEQMHLMSTRLPRQQFRIQVEPATARKANPFKLIKIHPKGRPASTKASTPSPAEASKQTQNRGQGDKVAATAVDGTKSGASSKLANKEAPATGQKGTGKKINSATLRKLLSQTLPKLEAMQNSQTTSGASGPASAAANSSQPGVKGPHFKFVFIQRATQAPASKGATKNKTKELPVFPESSSVSPSRTSHQATSNKNKQQQQQQQQPSLAASVSKQLANSLFYSAANLVGNLTSPSSSLVPSLTALASLAARHHVAQTDSKDHHGPVRVSSPASATKPSAANSAANDSIGTASNDIRRLSDHNHHYQSKTSATTKSVANALSAFTSMSSSAGTKTKSAKKSRPSKIYNLPVKFVANGQPNHVVFHTIKQHFATIKRLHDSVQSSANSNRAHSSTSQSSSGTSMGKRKKFNGSVGQTGTRLKGKNSRLIYLPLKYLSNAKPSMLNVIVGGTKASHKSTTGALKSKN